MDTFVYITILSIIYTHLSKSHAMTYSQTGDFRESGYLISSDRSRFRVALKINALRSNESSHGFLKIYHSHEIKRTLSFFNIRPQQIQVHPVQIRLVLRYLGSNFLFFEK